MEVFGRIQDICRIKPSEVLKAQILFYLAPLSVLFQSFKLEDKDLSRAEDLRILCLRKQFFRKQEKESCFFALEVLFDTFFCSRRAL